MLSKELASEVKKMFLCISVMLIVMICVFALCGFFSSEVVFGALLGGVAAFLNFLFLALAVEKSVNGDTSAKGTMASSYSIRLMFIAAVVVFSIKSPHFNYIATAIPLIFPRIIIMLNNLLKKRVKK